MRNSQFAKLPKFGPMAWVIENKTRVTLGSEVKFKNYIDYSQVHQDQRVMKRQSFLGIPVRAKVETKEHHYHDEYINR